PFADDEGDVVDARLLRRIPRDGTGNGIDGILIVRSREYLVRELVSGDGVTEAISVQVTAQADHRLKGKAVAIGIVGTRIMHPRLAKAGVLDGRIEESRTAIVP